MRILPLCLFLVSAAACTSYEQQYATYRTCVGSELKVLQRDEAPAQTAGQLVPIAPSELADAVRAKARDDEHANLRNQWANAIAQVRCKGLEPAKPWYPFGGPPVMMSAAGSAPEVAASQVSGTNNQVAGVDEADFIKNDTKYIYVASGTHLRVVEAWPAPTAHEVSSVVLPGKAKKLLVHGDRAVVYSSPAPSIAADSRGECTYGYSCSFAGDGLPTTIQVFDLTDKAQPKLLRTYSTNSSLVAARRIGNAVHTVLTLAQPERLVAFTVGGSDEVEINHSFEQAVAAADADIDARGVNWTAPSVQTEAGAPVQQFYGSTSPGGGAFTSVLSIDLTGSDAALVSVFSRAGAVSASANALYLAVPQQRHARYAADPSSDLSTVHKFAIGESPQATTYRGSGPVKGHVISQLAMDEHEGMLRIATSAGWVPDPHLHSAITVLEEQGGHLVPVGIVDNIAQGEDIRSVRFDSGRAYMVTFKKTDPLYVFDLQDPRAPAILGELKIPGFSTYIHALDSSHLLTIGYDAADQGDFAYFTGVLLQIFDVEDPSQPRLMHKAVIGTRGSSSEALTNPLAFTYFAPKELLALPMTVCEGGNGNGGYGSTMSFSGLMVYRATVENGFGLRGQVAHPRSPAASCDNWWTDASSDVRRSIVMDDYVFSVSGRVIKVNHLDALDESVAEIDLEER